MTVAEAISFGLDAWDIIAACLVLGHSRFVRNVFRISRNSRSAIRDFVRYRTRAGELGAFYRVGGYKLMDDWDDGLRDLIEPVPIDDVFVTGMCRIESLGDGGIVRGWFYAEEAGTRILRAKLVIPLACAAIMNLHGTNVFTKMLRNRPHIAKLVLP